ncbi:alpha/beta hydrolase [Streptomyces sp. cg36]|uniref:alpha/beta hydrolase n=1 Tax=Streptomyces sp. cg36 TaxID=3238798 RepID=UPI0034E2D4ED
MRLTSTAFFVTLIVVCLLVMAATLLVWQRIPGPGWVRWPARTALLVLCQLTAIAATATWINSSFGLYASWNDLLGRDTLTENPAMAGVPPRMAKFSRGTSGTLTTQFRGPASKLSGQVIVWAPPGHHVNSRTDTPLPVVLLLHGVPGGPQSWLENGHMPAAFERLVEDGATHPFLLVMPVVDPGGVDTDCSDTPRRKVATWLAKDVPDLVRQHFRTLSGPKAWGVMGYSTGGYCAAKLPLQFPSVFGAGAALDPDPLAGEAGVLPDPALRARNAPTTLVRGSRANVALFLATSRQDRESPPAQIEAFVQAAKGSSVRVSTLIRPTGGHNYGTWTGMYPDAFAFLSSELTAPAG